MKKISIRKQRKTLKQIIRLIDASPFDSLSRPLNFENNFPFLSARDLNRTLHVLADEKLISVKWADLPDSFNILWLSVTPKGFNYFSHYSLSVRQKWIERLYGFLSGVAITVLAQIVTDTLAK